MNTQLFDAQLLELLAPYRHIDFRDDDSIHVSAARLLIEFTARAVLNARRAYGPKDSWRNKTPLETITCEGEAIRALREGRAPDFTKFNQPDEGDHDRRVGLREMRNIRIRADFEAELRKMEPERAIDRLIDHVSAEVWHY